MTIFSQNVPIGNKKSLDVTWSDDEDESEVSNPNKDISNYVAFTMTVQSPAEIGV